MTDDSVSIFQRLGQDLVLGTLLSFLSKVSVLGFDAGLASTICMHANPLETLSSHSKDCVSSIPKLQRSLLNEKSSSEY